MDDESLNKLSNFNDVIDLIEFIKPYYPEIKIKKYEIEEIEKALYFTFIKLIGKIISYSPSNMRQFLRGYLLQFEIMNIKWLVLGIITGLNKKQKSEKINFYMEELLGNTEFINRLLDANNLDELLVLMRKSKFYRSVREGILYYNNYNETFILEAFLDQLYYLTMKREVLNFTQTEKRVIKLYIDSIIEIYNINLIYRGILNNIDRNLLSQFIVNNFLFMDENKIQKLLFQDNIEGFISVLEEIFKSNIKTKRYYKSNEINLRHLYWWIQGIYINYFFHELKPKPDDFEYTSVLKIIEILIKKQKEIQFNIIPNMIRLVHKKFEILEEGE